MKEIKEKLYQETEEYGALHNEDCCVNFEDSGACDAGMETLDCCDNMRMAKSIIDDTAKTIVEYLSHDMEDRKSVV